MDWGTPFKAAWNGATSAGKTAANAVSSSAKYAYDAVKRGAVAAKDAAMAGATMAKDAAMAGAIMAKDAAVAGASAAKEAVGGIRDAVREGTISARERQIRNAYATGRAHLSEHPAGCPSQSCPYKKAECDRLKDAKNKAIMAEHAYVGQGKDEDADRSAQLEKMLKDNDIQALNPVDNREELAELFADEDFAKMLEPDKSSFRARVYKMPRVGEQPPYEYVVSFRGTVPSEVQDLWADGAQAVGIPTGHYNKAMEIAEALRSSNTMLADSNGHPPKVSFAGHSLGGGLASVAAVVSGYPASTYNAAGLNMGTVAGVPIEKAGGQSMPISMLLTH